MLSTSSNIEFEPNKVILGDPREVLRSFPDSSFDIVVTSPPYFGLREYTDDPREIGREYTKEQFILSLLSVFDAVEPKLKPTGSLWINIADTYRGGAPLNVPESLNHMMVNTREWHLINRVIWYKVDAMSESVTRRFSQKYEMFYWYVKSIENYYFDEQASKIPIKLSSVQRLEYKFNDGKATSVSRMRGMLGDMSHKVDSYLENGVNCGDIWAIPTNKIKVEHAAPYPVELCVRPIVACCPDGGNVFDPFAGSGTTGVATLEIGGGRTFYGTDINPSSVQEANETRLKPLSIQPTLF